MDGSKKEAALPRLSETLLAPIPDEAAAEALELDQMWSFVLKKTRKRWRWIALSGRTRQVGACVIGDGRAAICRPLWERIPQANFQAHCYTDLWGSLSTGHPGATAHGCR